MKDENKKFMQRAITLAKKAWGKTSPNPLVGALIVKDGKIVGEGFHHKAGEAHAEINAIKSAGENAKNGTLFVTLEPCCTFGQTPPCTDAIIAAKIEKVIIGCMDQNPLHTGNAKKILENAGIEVEVGILENDCKKLNTIFFHWIQHKKPFVVLKMGMTFDGKTATESGISQWITGEKSREKVQKLRMQSGAIMVGGETVRRDNPALTVRAVKNWQQPFKIIATRKNDFSLDLNIFKGEKPEFVELKDSQDWENFLLKLGKKGITQLLIEGGSELAANAIENKAINQIIFFIAPKIMGGQNSISAIGGKSPKNLETLVNLSEISIEKAGLDFMVTAQINYTN